MESNVRGTSAAYLRMRIVRDHPDVARRLHAGEFKSVRAAALVAGLVQPVLSVRITDPASMVRSLRKHMTPGNLSRLVDLLQEKN